MMRVRMASSFSCVSSTNLLIRMQNNCEFTLGASFSYYYAASSSSESRCSSSSSQMTQFRFICSTKIAARLMTSSSSICCIYLLRGLFRVGWRITEWSRSCWQIMASRGGSIQSAMMQFRSVMQSFSSRKRWQQALRCRRPARPISCTQFSMLLGMLRWMTHYSCQKSKPIPKATVATTILTYPLRNFSSVSVFCLLGRAEWYMATGTLTELLMQLKTSSMIFLVRVQTSMPLHSHISGSFRYRMSDQYFSCPRQRLTVTKRFLFMQLDERTTSAISNFSTTEATVQGLAVAVSPNTVGRRVRYLTICRITSLSIRKEVLKLWLSSEREWAQSTQTKLASGKSCKWQRKSVCRAYGVRKRMLMFPFFTCSAMLRWFSLLISELMQAPVSSKGRCSSWSSMSDTSGLITMLNPFRIIELIMQVSDLPEAVQDMNIVERPPKMCWIVSNWPSLKAQKPKQPCKDLVSSSLDEGSSGGTHIGPSLSSSLLLSSSSRLTVTLSDLERDAMQELQISPSSMPTSFCIRYFGFSVPFLLNLRRLLCFAPRQRSWQRFLRSNLWQLACFFIFLVLTTSSSEEEASEAPLAFSYLPSAFSSPSSFCVSCPAMRLISFSIFLNSILCCLRSFRSSSSVLTGLSSSLMTNVDLGLKPPAKIFLASLFFRLLSDLL